MKIIHFPFYLMSLVLLSPFSSYAFDPYNITNHKALSSATWQFEVTSTVLPGDLADSMCTSTTRKTGDPQFFIVWENPDERIMPCALSELGSCDAVTSTGRTLPSPYFADSNDNITVRLADGRVASVFQTIKKCGPSNPNCPTVDVNTWDQVSYVTQLSQDCGTTWIPTILDVRTIPRQNGMTQAYAADRVEMYADPFSEYLFLTTSIGKFDWNPYDNKAGVILAAPMPAGVTAPNWVSLYEIPTNVQGSGSEFLVMTSMPHLNGVSRMYWLTCHLSRPIIYFADSPWVTGQGLSGPHYLDSLLSVFEGKPISEYACGGTAEAPDWSSTNNHQIRNAVSNYALARMWTDGTNDKLRVGYQQVRKVSETVNGAVTVKNYNAFRLVDLEVNSPDAPLPFYATTSKIIPDTAANPKASAIYPSIIQVDKPTLNDPDAATHLLHWSEVSDNNWIQEKVMGWNPNDGWLAEKSIPNSSWYCDPTIIWDPVYHPEIKGNCSVGDYQYGSFIDAPDKCTHNYFVPFGVADPNIGITTHGATVSMFASDPNPPTGSININTTNPIYTNNRTVNLSLSATDAQCEVPQMCVENSNSGLIIGCPIIGWEPYVQSKAWNLTNGDGSKAVNVWYKDSPGNISQFYSRNIILDTTPPAGSNHLAFNKTYSCSLDVQLFPSCTDSNGCTEVRFKNEITDLCGTGRFPPCPAWSNWEIIPNPKYWTLKTSTGSSNAVVRTQFRDVAGNTTDVVNTILVGAPGAPALSTPLEKQTNVSTTPTFYWNAPNGAESYTTQLCSDSNCATKITDDIVTGTQWKLPIILDENKTYFWRVLSNNFCGSGAYSAIRSFTTGAARKAMVNLAGFDLIQAAYNDTGTTNGSVIKMLGGTLAGPLVAAKSIEVNIVGGYASDYGAITNSTTLQGLIEIRSGRVTVNNVKIQ